MRQYQLARGPTLDKTDIAPIQVLLRDCRVSYRSINLSVGLSKNAVKTRIDKRFSAAVIRRFAISENPAVFGYSVICHLIVRDSKTIEETSDRLRMLVEPMVRLDCIEEFQCLKLR